MNSYYKQTNKIYLIQIIIQIVYATPGIGIFDVLRVSLMIFIGQVNLYIFPICIYIYR